MNLHTLKFPSFSVLVSGILYATLLGQVRGEDRLAMSPRVFASPAAATNELVRAAKAHDWQAIRAMFGPEVTNLLTGDSTLDEKHIEEFANDLGERCDPVPAGNDKVNLEIGRDRWPFPIPLIHTNGAWLFDTIAGEEEIVNRHIGRDEYYAIGVCRVYVKAQREYAQRFAGTRGTPKYAQRLKSSPGRMDGLYWPAKTNATPSPLSSFVAEASLEGYDWRSGKGPRPFHGYCFKILTWQGPAAPGGKMNYVRDGEMTGGFALVAYPVRWGASGIMTFVVNQDGVVYQRSLGEKTARIAAAMKQYNPDSRWAVVQEPGITELNAKGPSGKGP
jgi:hypothetical protein